MQDRVLYLPIVAAGKVCPPNAAAEECVAGEDAIGTAYQADAAGSMPWRVQYFQGERSEGNMVALVEENIWLSFNKRRASPIHFSHSFIGVHRNVGGMDREWYRINLAHC